MKTSITLMLLFVMVTASSAIGGYETPTTKAACRIEPYPFVSENEEILGEVDIISQYTQGRGIWVMDRGADRRKLYRPVLDRGLRFIIRLIGGRQGADLHDRVWLPASAAAW